MFTGIVAGVGTVARTRRDEGLVLLDIKARRIASELRRGDSVAVNGVCLTACAVRRHRFLVQVMLETLQRSTLGGLSRGSRVNLELPLRLADRLGGHLVQGHVDAVGVVSRLRDDAGSRRISVSVDEDVLAYVAEKGSVALDGVSLTVVGVDDGSFEVALIPHTLNVTTLGSLAVGTELNVEVDVIAKYVSRLVGRE